MPREIDPCPVCGASVDAVRVIDGACFTDPCLHKVEVTMWADRVALTT